MGEHRHNDFPSDKLEFHLQGIEALLEKKRDIALEISAAFKVAKVEGLDPKTMRRMIKLRELTQDQRDEQDALDQIYRGALGMLDGTPLGDSSRKRLERERLAREMRENQKQREGQDQDQEDLDDLIDKVTEIEKAGPPSKDPEDARMEGQQAARDGQSIYDNPYPANDPCRAAWDEGWCRHTGSDGMDIPKAFQRRKKKKEEEGSEADGADEAVSDDEAEDTLPEGDGPAFDDDASDDTTTNQSEGNQ